MGATCDRSTAGAFALAQIPILNEEEYNFPVLTKDSTMTTVSAFHPTIAVIDMQDLTSGDAGRRSRFVSGLHDAFSNVGFVAVYNPGVNSDVLKKAYEAAKTFFSSPNE